jgi:hypothetical protein
MRFLKFFQTFNSAPRHLGTKGYGDKSPRILDITTRNCKLHVLSNLPVGEERTVSCRWEAAWALGSVCPLRKRGKYLNRLESNHD